jgi:hemerythrin-like domain-containing protein
MAFRGGIFVDTPIAIWHAEHVRFERLLRFLDGQLAAFRGGGDPDYALMRDVVHYLQHVADGCHHPREDAAFKRLVERDPSLEIPVSRLLQEHRVLAAAGETLLLLLEDILEDVIVEREDVEAAAATYLLYYHHHLAEEEREILPRAAQLLTSEDWAAVAASVAAVPDPLLATAGDQYRDLRRQIQAQKEPQLSS